MGVPSGSDPSTLYGAELVTTPYVTPATFSAYPTYAELDNLVVDSISAAANLAQLNDMLIMSSQWASDQVNMPLHGHIHIENVQLRVQRNGALSFHPEHNPVRQGGVLALQYAWYLGGPVSAVTDLTGQWIEANAQVNLPFPAMNTSLNGIQFGPPVSTSQPIPTTWTYAAGYPCTQLAAPTIVGATTLTVTDPTAILPGDRLRIWEPGVEEAITVGAGYGIGSTTVPLSTALQNAHTAGAGLSAMPSDIMLAVVMYTAALAMRPDARAEDQFPDTRTGITTRSEDARRDGTGLVAEAYRLLRSFARVR